MWSGKNLKPCIHFPPLQGNTAMICQCKCIWKEGNDSESFSERTMELEEVSFSVEIAICSGLKNAPHSLRYLNTWSPVGGSVSGGLGSRACWRKFTTGAGYKIKSPPPPTSVCSLYFTLAFECASPQFPVPIAMPADCFHALPS